MYEVGRCEGQELQGRLPQITEFASSQEGRPWASLLLCFWACGAQGLFAAPAELKPAFQNLSKDRLLAHIRTLSSDEFEGRAPGTKGEDLAVAYLSGQFRKLGLKPGNPDGSYVQKVPLVGFKSDPTAQFDSASARAKLRFPQDFVAVSRHFVPEVKVEDSEVVFVGYGVIAPEYAWDDYKGADLKGKTLVMLVGDPPVPDPADPSRLDEKVFKGKAMTYYGRWTYKYEIASRLGAAAALIVHETGPAGYPYEVVMNSWGGENCDVRGSKEPRVSVEAWVSSRTAVELFAMGGQDFAALKARALSRDFRPVSLGLKANLTVKNALREMDSRNVLARLEGSDPRLKDEYVVYTAHWDHLGKDPKLAGDQIYNGAVDNASGVAGLLELARAFKSLDPRPKRSVLFLSVTAEEQGLLGSKYYAAHPLYPLKKTLAEINMDSLNVWGPTKDIIAVGLGNSSLDDFLEESARAAGRVVLPDQEPEKGYFYRSDHFEFAKKGVPALDYGAGVEVLGKPAGYGKAKRDYYTAHDYHKVSDEIKPDWDLGGAVEDLKLLMEVGWRVAQAGSYPVWKEGTEFKALREASLR